VRWESFGAATIVKRSQPVGRWLMWMLWVGLVLLLLKLAENRSDR